MKNAIKLDETIDLDKLAKEWGGAYRADYNGRGVSCEVIRALLEYGYNCVGFLTAMGTM